MARVDIFLVGLLLSCFMPKRVEMVGMPNRTKEHHIRLSQSVQMALSRIRADQAHARSAILVEEQMLERQLKGIMTNDVGRRTASIGEVKLPNRNDPGDFNDVLVGTRAYGNPNWSALELFFKHFSNFVGITIAVAIDAKNEEQLKSSLKYDFHTVVVSPWEAFVQATNALVQKAHELNKPFVLMVSVEAILGQWETAFLLGRLRGNERILVAGARAEFHAFSPGPTAHPLRGHLIPWNTFAAWNVKTLLSPSNKKSILHNTALKIPFQQISTQKGAKLELPFHDISTRKLATGLHVNYQFYRIIPKMLRDGTDLTKWTIPALEVFSGNSEPIDVDPSIVDVSRSPPFLQISFSQKTRINEYRLVTSRDGDPAFDPVQWEFDGSDCGKVWFGLDLEQRKTPFDTPRERSTVFHKDPNYLVMLAVEELVAIARIQLDPILKQKGIAELWDVRNTFQTDFADSARELWTKFKFISKEPRPRAQLLELTQGRCGDFSQPKSSCPQRLEVFHRALPTSEATTPEASPDRSVPTTVIVCVTVLSCVSCIGLVWWRKHVLGRGAAREQFMHGNELELKEGI